MRRYKGKYSIISAVLACALTINLLPLAALAKEGEIVSCEGITEVSIPKERVVIETVEDLLELAENCRIADYSANRQVDLARDLDLGSLPKSEEFPGITSFSGIFNGNGHMISGLELTRGSEAVGLFLYVEEGAVVQDLTVMGVIGCADSKNKVGGIAGINAGTIRNCTFRGLVTGVGVTGGIAGVNGLHGSLIRCTAEGAVNSVHSVGGIVGQNRGSVSDCVNLATVNGGTDWMELEDEGQVSLSPSGVLWTVREEAMDGNDFGGIAGWSNGVIAGCENKGIVGYRHAGRNVGGIVGRQSGELILCTNSGRVFGKQDVGGIVGQLEPKTTYEDVDELSGEVNELHDLMEKMIDDMEAMGDDLHGDFGDLNRETSAAFDTADALMDEMRDVIGKNVDVINELARRIDYAMNHFSVVMTYLNAALDTSDVLLDDLDKVREDLSINDRMEGDEYDPAKEKRLVLMAGQGGSLGADNLNPAEGVRVTVTITPEKGYRLSRLTRTPYGGESEDVTGMVVEDQYVMDSMPEDNLTIAAVFEYVGGQYVVSSNAGGRAFLSEDQTSLRLQPEAGYRVSSVTIEDGDNLYSGAGDEVALPEGEAGAVRTVWVIFEKLQGAHRVNTVTGTGGGLAADPQVAEPGEVITLTFTAGSGYTLDPASFSVRDGMGNPIAYQTGLSYTFVMPDSDATVEAGFQYTPTSDTTVYAVSNVGGSVTTITNPTTGRTNVVITCEDGYCVDHMTVTDSAAVVNSYVIQASEMTRNDTAGVYSYELATSTLTTPVKVDVAFAREAQGFYPVTGVCGTGGRIMVDKSSVTGGDTLSVAVANEAHYVLEHLLIGGVDYTGEVEDNKVKYTVPTSINGTLDITARFRPVVLILKSDSVGGSGTYVVSGKDVVITIQPETGYYLERFLLTDAAGDQIPCQKEYADSEVYKVQADALGGEAGYLTMVFQRLNNKETVDQTKENLENQTDNVVEGVNNIASTSDAIRALLTDGYGNAKQPEDLTEEELEQLGDLLLELMGYVSDTSVAAGGVLGDTNTMIRVVGPYAEDTAEEVSRDLEQLSQDARRMNDYLQGAGRELKGIVDYLNALDDLQAVKLSQDFDDNSDLLKDQLDTISDLLSRLDRHANIHSEQLEDDMRAVNDKLNRVLNLLIRKLDNMEELINGEDIIDDRSEEEGEASRVTNCTNTGVVRGDQNTGGIAGTCGVEINNAEEEKEISIGNRYVARAVISGCHNSGYITVKNENAGGIAGNLEVGCLKECFAGGRIQSEAGRCLGGIAGISRGTIDACSSSAVLSGGLYIGGIAGQADCIRNSYSMASILQAEGWMGAIAGQDRVDSREEDITLNRSSVRDRISGNYYVSSKLYGINGVSYMGVAEPLTYEELLAREDVPTEFHRLTVTFIDGEENPIQSLELPYGADLTKLQYPHVAADSGDYMEWEGIEGDILEGNLVIQAVVTSNVTILSSNRGDGGRPLALAEGTFTETAVIRTEEYRGQLPGDVPVGAVCHAYQVILENTELEEDDTTRVRLYNVEGGHATVYRLEGDGWTRVTSKTVGSYEEVEMVGARSVFCVATVEKEQPILWILVTAALALVVLILAGRPIIDKRRKKVNNKSGCTKH